MLEYLLSLLLIYQYWLIFGISLGAAFGFPLPATAVLIAGGAFYTQGYLDISFLLLSGFTGCVSGDILGYSLSYIYGKDILLRIGFGRFINIDHLIGDYGKSFMKKSILSVFLTRWLITGLGPSINLLAGIMKMPPVTFILVDLVGEALYILIVVSIGYSFGSEWESILDILESFSTMIMSFLFILLSFYIFRKIHLRKSKKIEESI